MVIPLALHIFLIHSRIKFKRLEVCQIKTHSIKEHFYLKTIKYMPMDMKMIMLIFIILFKKYGKKSDFNFKINNVIDILFYKN